MNVFFSILAGLLVALALTTVIKAEHVIFWQLSILATEFGHWLFLLSVALATTAWFVTHPTSGKPVFILGAFVVCAVLFARPVAQAYVNETRWAADLQKGLGLQPSRPLMSLSHLWGGRGAKPAEPETHTYMSEPTTQTFLFYRATSATPAPWVLMIHGGGWDSGDPAQLPELTAHLIARGYSVASISYRLAPKWKWPAQKEDAFRAADYIKAHATELNIDPTRWVVMGRSAGGQIAQAVAYQKSDSSLKGVITYYAPADMDFAFKYAKDKDIINSKDLLINFLGARPEQAPDAYKDASPIQYVEASTPPTLLFHGRQDPLTWSLQSRRLYDKLIANNRPAAYIEFPWATHAFDFNLNGPAGQIATSAVDLFLDSTLRGVPAKS